MVLIKNRNMKRKITLLLLALIVVAGANAQLLYKISGKDLQSASYVIGTHHLANVSFVEKIPGVKDAIIATEQVYGEVNMDVLENTDTLKMMQATMTLPEGQSLKTVLTAEQFKKVDNFIKEKMGVGLSSPQVMKQMGYLTPAALTAQLTVLVFVLDHMGEFDPTSTFDQYFQAQAKKNNEPVGGLETAAFQANLIYKAPALERQVEQLMCFIDNESYNLDLLNQITDAYYAQNIDEVGKLMEEKVGNSCDATAEENDALIYARNADWAERMPAIMEAKPTFFAVGAGHLPGDKGLLQLLRNAGYTVEAVQ